MDLNISDKREFFSNAMNHSSGFFISRHFSNNVKQRNYEGRLLNYLYRTKRN